MAYTAPKSWSNEPLIASDMNTHIRDNMIALKDPPSAVYNADESADYTTTSTSFTNVDGTDTEGKFRHTITTTGGLILVTFCGMVVCSSAGARIFLDVSLDGTRVGGPDGITGFVTNGNGSFSRWIQAAAGSHVLRLMWKVTAGTGTLYAGAGTANGDIHPQFVAREVS